MKLIGKSNIGWLIVLALIMLAQLVVQQVRAGDCEWTYDNFGKVFMEKYCTKCHSSSQTGLARRGAPAGYDFDMPETIAKEKKDIIEYTVEKKKMPPFFTNPKPDDQERGKLKDWLNCEYP